MCERKYYKYSVIIEFLNGDKENINYEEEKSRNYSEMLELYRQTKEQYKDECVTISFCGITEDNKINVLFEKCIVNKEELKIKEEADEIANSSGQDVLLELKEIINKIQRYRGYINGQEGVYDKKQDILLHKIESNKLENIEDEIRMMRELKQLRLNRRKVKINSRIIDRFFNKLSSKKIVLNNICDMIDLIIKEENTTQGKIVPLTDEKVEEFKIAKILRFKNFKERLNMMKQLQPKYDKVVYDDSRMEITCYNKAR